VHAKVQSKVEATKKVQSKVQATKKAQAKVQAKKDESNVPTWKSPPVAPIPPWQKHSRFLLGATCHKPLFLNMFRGIVHIPTAAKPRRTYCSTYINIHQVYMPVAKIVHHPKTAHEGPFSQASFAFSFSCATVKESNWRFGEG